LGPQKLDHKAGPSYDLFVKEIAFPRFRATCRAVFERVRLTGQPVLVTRFGEPLAEIVPPRSPARRQDWLGAMRGTGEILDDIVAPLQDRSAWETEA
jgi:antitoxin (DNA-binding transcriptional repressor) of toxin-antitoxin stability system